MKNSARLFLQHEFDRKTPQRQGRFHNHWRCSLSCTLYVENHAAIRARLGIVQQPIGQRNSPVEYQPQRLLLSQMPDDEETKVKQMKSYFGGLYPPVDKDMMPLYLRNTLDTESSVLVMDLYHSSGEPVVKARDPIFFWHIPRVSVIDLIVLCCTASFLLTLLFYFCHQAAGSTMKNIMNFCFDLKRAEKLSEEPVRCLLILCTQISIFS